MNMVLNSQTNNPSKTLLIADAELKGIELLLSGELKADHILLVQRDDDALFKLERYLNSAGREFSQYFILCHGAPGKLKLGAHEIDTNQLAVRTSLNLGLSKWMRGKRLGLIACSVSAQECGVRLLEALGQHWGVRVSASPTKLGHTEAGRNWAIMDNSGTTSTLPLSSFAMATYEYSLDDNPFDEGKVNLYTSGDQDEPVIRTLADGSYILVWTSQNQDGSGDGIFAQRFSESGARLGAEFQISDSAIGDQNTAAVAALSGGGYVVTWEAADGSGTGIYKQQFDASDQPLGGVALVNTSTSSSQYEAQVTGLTDGGYVVVWRDGGSLDGSGDGVFAQRYDAAGNAVGSEFQVNTEFSSSQFQPSVSPLGDGFVVAWASFTSGTAGDGSGYGIFVQRYSDTGTALGGEVQINLETSGNQTEPRVTELASGNFVVVWTSATSGSAGDGSSDGVFARLFNASGTPLSGEIQVNTTTSSNQQDSAITALAGGGFVIVWTDQSGADGSSSGVFGQEFDASGNPVGSEFQVNEEISSVQYQPTVTALDNGGYVVAWSSFTSGSAGDGSGYGIFSKTFGDPAAFSIQASPEVDGIHTNVTYDENDLNSAPQLIDTNGASAVSDADSANFDGGTLIVSRITGFGIFDQFGQDAESQEQFGIRNQGTAAGQIGVSGTDVTYGGIVIGSITSDGSNGGDLVVTLNASANPTSVEALVENLTYENTSDDPVASRDITIQLSDGDGGTSEPVIVTINITPSTDGVGPVFGERQVNSFVEGEQREPSVASLADGGYVVIWESDNEDGSGYGIFAQRYTAEGVITGPEFIVNSQIFGDQVDARVTGLDGGGFVVSWTDQVSSADGSGYGVFAQRFGADGLPAGSEFLVNTTTSSFQYESAIAALNDGGFVAVWRDDSGSDGSSAGVQGQRFDAAGNPVGGEFQVNTEFSSFQYEPSVSGLSGGGFVVTWTSFTSGSAGDGSGQGIFAQRYDAAGNPQGGEFLVNTEVTGDQRESVVAGLADGTFVVAWTDQSGLDTSNYGVYAQHYAADGSALGGQFRVNENVSSNQYEPAITALDGGGFVISWRDDSGRDGSGTGVFAQQYDATASRVDGEFQVNTEFSSTQSQVALAGLSGDNFVAVWRSQNSGTAGDGSGGGIFQQLFGEPADFGSQASPILSEFTPEVTFSEAALNAGALLLDANQSVYVADSDSADFDGGSLLVTRLGLLEPILDQFESPDDGTQDQLSVQNQGVGAGQIGVSGSSVTYEGGVIGTIVSDGSNGSRLEITFNSNADAAAVEALVERLTYANTSDDPVPFRQFRIQISDGDGGTSEPVVVKVNVTPEQDGVAPVFGERQVNSFVEGEQREPSVASLADGGYVVVWDSDGEDGSGYGIFGQRYTAEGVITGPEFIVNSQIFGDQVEAQVTGLNGGGFVVSWTDQSSNADGSSWGIFAQRFGADGLPAGGEFLVNTTTSSSQQESAIAALNDGGFVAVWQDNGGADGSSSGVLGQRFDSAGNPVGGEFQVNTEFSSFQYEPSVSGLSGGGFVVTWTSATSGSAGDGSGQGIFAQRYDAAGNPLGGEFLVNTEVTGEQRESVVAGLADGTFVVAWTDQSGLDTSNYGVYAQHYAADGSALGGQFRVNENVSSNQYEPAITALDGGGFVISWRDDSGRDGSGTGVFAQQYDATASRVDGEFQVNTEFSSTQSQVALAGLSGDNFVAVWRSQNSGTAGDGSGGGIFQQLFGEPADFGSQASPTLEGVNTELDLFEGDVNTTPQLLDANGAVALSDLDSSDFDGGMVLVSRQIIPVPLLGQLNVPDDATQDQLGVRNEGPGAGQIGVSGTAVTYGGIVIGTIASDGSNGSNLQIDLNSNATVEAVEALVENLTYANPSDDPVDTRQFRIQVSDGDGGTSEPALVNVNIIPEVDGVEAIGAETQVNTETAAEQSEPSAATLSDGSYIVVWRSDSSGGSADGSGFGIFGQRFAADGSPLGTEFQINTQAVNAQDQPDVAALTGGGFVVTWRDQNSSTDGSSSAVSAQRFDNAGVSQGSEFVVNSTTSSGQYEPAIAELNDGGFVVVYRDDSGSDGSSSGVQGQRFDAAGNPVGTEFQVNTETGSFQYEPGVSSLAGGGFVVTWTSSTSGSAGDGSGQGIFAQRYDAAGNPVGSEFLVNTGVSGDQRESVVAGLADGTFVVAWTDRAALDASSWGVFGQHFAADGTPLGEQFRVNESTSSNQYEPAITAIDNGGFVISWRDDSGRDGSGAGVFGQQYDASAARVDGEFQVNTEFSSSQYEPALTHSAGGGFVALWSSLTSGTAGDGSSSGVFLQRFQDASPAPYEPPSDLLNERPVNLFTSADQDAPASATLTDGSYVLVWTSAGQDGDSDGIFAQRFNASGERIGPEFQANTQPIGQQYQAEIGALNDGGFVISWTANTGQDGSGAGVFAQRYDASGATVGGEFQVNTETSSTQDSPVVAGLSGGGFVVIWDSTNSGTAGDGSGDGVFGQRYDAAGSPVGSEFQVNTEFSSNQNDPAVSALGTGFIVTWTSNTSGSAGDGSGLGVFAQRYDASGTPLGTEFQVNVETASTQDESEVVELAGGNFAVVWTSTTSGSAGDGSSNGVFARLFDAAGTALTGEVLVNTTTASNQEDASIAALSGGGFVVTWTDNSGSDGSGWGVFGQEFDAAGTPVGAEFQVNQEFTSTQYQPTVTGLANDTFAVAWSSFTSGSAGDGSGYGVFQRLFGDAADFTVQADPELEGLPSVVSYLENDLNAAPQLIDTNGAVAVSDMDSADFEGGQLVVSRLVGFGSADQFGLDAESQEQLGIRNQGNANGEIGVSGGSVSYGGTVIGSVLSDGSNGSDLIVEFNSNATAEALEALAENLTYQNTSSDPVPSRQYTVQISDGDGGSSDPHIITIDIEPEVDGAAPVFGERQTNSFVTGSQEDPAVASLADGGYVIVWESDAQDGSGNGVFGQRYNAEGVIVGPEFLVNGNVLGSQVDPQVAGLVGGGFVVTWTDQDSSVDGSGWGVFAQQYQADGTPQGTQFLVNTTTSSSQYEPSVAVLNDGGYLIAYRDGGNADGSFDGVFAQRYDAAGATVGVEFQVNTEASSNQFDPSVASLADGGFVIAWTSVNSGSAGDGDGWGTFAQRYNAAGTPVGSEFQVNTNVQGSQYEAVVVGLSGGGFVVAWRDDSGLDGSGNGVFAQLYDASGAPVGGEFRVNETTSNSQTEPAIAALDNGGFAVAWRDGNSPDDVFAQQYDAVGNRVDGEFRVNTETASTQASPSIAGLPGGNFVVAWQSFTSGSAGDGSNYGISHQLFGDAGDFFSQASPELAEVNSTVTFAENLVNAVPQLLDANGSVSLTDVDSTDFAGGSVLVSRLTIPEPLLDQFENNDDGTQDLLGVRNQGTGAGQIGVSGNNVTYEGTVIGSVVSDGQGSNPLEISLNASADAEAVEALIENLTYQNLSDNPVESRQYRIQVSDGDGGTSEPAVVSVNITPERDGAEAVFEERTTNSFVEGNQDEPAIAGLANGGYVIVWESDEQDGTGSGVFGQRYSADGVIVGPEFLVNTQVLGSQVDPQVTGLAGGGFVVTWTDQLSGVDGSGWGIFAQRFGVDGQALGSQFQVNSTTASSQSEPSIAALNDGGFLIAYRDGGNADGSADGVFAQRYDATGATVGAEFQVNTQTSSNQFDPSAASLADGGFVITWTSVNSGSAGDGDGWGTFAQRYNAAGNPVGGEFQVNTNTQGSQYEAVATGLTGGGFVITWRDDSALDSASSGVFAQLYDAAGNSVGSEFRVNETTEGSEFEPTIAALDTGGFVIAWRDSTGSDDVYAQQYDSAGNRIDGEILVNTETGSTQASPAIAALPNGNFVVAWQSFTSGTAGDGSGYGISHQLFGNVGDFSSQAAPELEAFNSEITLAESAVNLTPQLLDANAAVAVSDADSSDFDGGNILVSRLNIPEAMLDQFNIPDDGTQDQLGVRNQGVGPAEVGVSGTSVTYGGTVVGTIVSNGQNGSPLEITLNANASAEAVEAVVENLTYANTSDDPVPSRQFRVQISDGDGGTSQPQVVTVNITPTPDAAVPIFGERQANTETDGTQDESAVATLSDGSFVIVWTSQSSGTAGDGDGDGVFGQHFDALGNPLGAEFQINTETATNQNNPQITATSDGGFVVVWQSASSGSAGDGSSNAVIGRQFDGVAGDGTPTASAADFVINTSTSSAQDEPDVVALPGGGFVVVWESSASGAAGGDGSGVGVIGQVFDAAGATVGAEFVVNTETSSTQFQPKVTALSDGGFLVVWTSVTSGDAGDGDSNGIFAQRYDAVGSAVDRDGSVLGVGESGEFQINVTIDAAQDVPDVAGLAGGGFVVTWESSGQDGSGDGIYARQFADNGLPVANEFRVNDERGSSQLTPAVTALDTGGFVVTWRDDSGRDGSGTGVFGQQYDASGNRLDSEFQVNTEFSSTQFEPALSALPGGGFVVSWSAFTSGASGDGSGYGVFYQLYGNAPPQVTDGDVDGFEDQLLVLSDQLFVDNFDDPDGQGLAFIEIAVLPDNGDLLLSGAPVSVGDQISLAQLANGDLAYLGDSDYFGPDTFGWRGSDGLVLSTEVAQTNITLAPVNDAPGLEAGADGTSTEGQNFSQNLTLSDPDPDTYTITVDWGDGSEPLVFNSANKSPNINHTFALEGTYTVTVTVNDNSAAANAEETDTFEVTVENGNPIARDDFFTVDEDDSVNGNVLLNNGTGADSDTGGDTLSISAVNGVPADIGSTITLSSGALLTLNADGTFAYDTNGAFDSLSGTQNGADSFTYTLSDGDGGTDTATVNLTINGLNDDPIAQDDNVSTNENVLLNGNVLVNNGNGADEDIDGGVGGLTVVAVNGSPVDVGAVATLASGALLTLNANGTFSYDPNGQFDSLDSGETGGDSFTYTIEDEGGAQDTATVNVTVNGVGTTNTPPVAQDDSFTTDEDTAIAGNVLSDNGSGADADADGDTLTVTTVGTFATTGGGLININADGSFNYSPNAAFESLAAGENDADSFTYTLSDGNGGTDTATVNFAIDGVNDAPDAVNDLLSTDEDTPLSGNVFANNGVAADSDAEGDIFVVSAVNGNAVNVGVQITLASGALLTVNGDGTFTYDPNAQFESLGVGQSDTDSFTYTIDDGNGGTDTATVTLAINGVNDAPDAVDDAFATDEDTALSANVLADNGAGSDSDVEGDALVVTEVNGNALNVGAQITLASGALLTLNANGSFDYDPNGQFETVAVGDSTSESFSYTVSDGNGGTDTATATITIDGVNDAPVAADDALVTDEDSPVNGNVLADNGNGADSDVDGDTLTVSAGSFATAKGGQVTLNADGTFTYDPSGAFEGLNTGDSDTDAFTYTLGDGNGGSDTATVNIVINGVTDVPDNVPPVAQDDNLSTNEDTPLSGSVLVDNGNGSDSDADGDTLTVTQVNGNGLNVGTQITLASGALLTLNANGSFDYDPNGQFEGLAVADSTSDSFSYTVSDGNGGTDTATATITIDGVNDSPVAADDALVTDEDSAVNGNVLADNGDGADSDVDGDTLTVTAGSFATAKGGQVTLNADGTFTYDPSGVFESLAVGDSDTDSFTYTLGDGNGGTDTATVTLTINGANDAPVAADDNVVTDEDSPVTGNVLVDNGNGADSDVDGDTLTVTAGSFATAKGGQVTLNADGTFTYDPNGQFESLNNGDTDSDSFSYTVSDGEGGTDTATVNIAINGVTDQAGNVAPDVVDENYSVHAGEVLTVAAAAGLLANDTDADGDPLNVQSIEAPANGTLNIATDGSFTYTPDPGFVGTEELTYTVSDGTTTSTGTVTIEVQNEAPVVGDDSYTVHAGQVLTVAALDGLLANDTDADGDSLNVQSIEAPANGTLNIATDGSFTYTPDPGFVGTEELTYTVSDGTTTSTGTVTIEVRNEAPVVGDDSYTVRAGQALTVAALDGLLANDSDADGDPLNVQSIEAPANGTLNIATDGSFTYTPDPGFVGTEELTYTVSDGTTNSTGTVTIDVLPSEVETISLGDAPTRLPRSDRDAWSNAWTDASVTITHKADITDSGEVWSNASLSAAGSHVLSGGDIYAGDLGVSGQAIETGQARQEIEGTEALRFELDGVATEATLEISRLDTEGAFWESGRVQALDDQGNVVAEVLFNADDLAGDQPVQISSSQGFTQLVLTAGTYDGSSFVYGALADDQGDYAAPANGALSQGSDYLLDSVEFVFGAVATEPEPLQAVAQSAGGEGSTTDVDPLEIDMPLIGIQEPEGPDQFV